jgi:hypothetical protein
MTDQRVGRIGAEGITAIMEQLGETRAKRLWGASNRPL